MGQMGISDCWSRVGSLGFKMKNLGLAMLDFVVSALRVCSIKFRTSV